MAATKNGAPRTSADEQVRAVYERSEASTAEALEELVAKPSFGWMFSRSAENIAAVVRISSDMADLMLEHRPDHG